MNRPQAAQVCATIAAAYPWDLTDDQIETWYRSALHNVDLDLGLEVAIRLVETEERFPTPARFNKERGLVERLRYAEANEAATQQALAEMPKSSRELAEDARRKFFTDMRAMVGQRAALLEKHDHHGPTPCLICGGCNPDAVVALSSEQRSRFDVQQSAIRNRTRETA